MLQSMVPRADKKDMTETYEDALAEIEAREQAIARREAHLDEREQEAGAELMGVEGRCRALQRALREMDAEDARHLLARLPSVAPPPGRENRDKALRARRQALTDRELAARGRERAMEWLDGVLREATARLNEVTRLSEQLSAPDPTPPPRLSPPSDEPEPAEEKRVGKQPRRRIDCTVSLESKDNFYAGFARNLSSGGLFIATFDLQPVGTELDVRFSLPSGQQIEARAGVRWVRELPDDADVSIWPGMGVEFQGLTEEAQAAINRFMNLREPMFFVD